AGPNDHAFDVGITATYRLLGLTIAGVDFVILGGTSTIFVLLWLFLQRTRMGFAIRAVAQDPEAARTMGIDADRTVQLVFFVGSAIAAFGGVMVGILYNAGYPTIGDTVSYKGLALIVIGGAPGPPSAA